MTWPPKIPWWAFLVAILVAVLAVTWAFNDRRRLARDLAAVEDRHALEVAGLHAAAAKTKHDLLEDVAGLTAKNAAMATLIAKLQAASPGATPVYSGSGSTGTVIVGPVVTAPDAPAPVAPGPPSPPGPATTPCVVSQGDGLKIDTDITGWTTKAGNLVVLVTNTLRWVDPRSGREVPIFTAPSEVSGSTLRGPTPPGWGAGLFFVGGDFGFIGGPQIAFPQWTLLGLTGDASTGIGLGPGGHWGWLLSAVARF